MVEIIHTWRTKDGTKTGKLNLLKAIQYKCFDCSGWSRKEVELCPVKTCPLWPFRTNKVYDQFLAKGDTGLDDASK